MPALPQSKVDWTVPQPTYEELHAKLDALETERNAAVAEAKLWLRRLLTAQQERDQARADYQACNKSHEEWEAAYEDLLRDFRRLEVRFDHLCWNDESRTFLLKHLDPFLPPELQDAEARAKEPALYAQIAAHQRGAA